MTGRDMTDEQVRAELERIGFEELWDQASNIKATLYAKNGSTMSFHHSIENALRPLAEFHAALGKIVGLLQHQLDNEDPDDLITILQLLDVLMIIARKYYRGEYQGPKPEPILPVSLKCKCGYELKPEDKSCPNCERLFGKKGGFNGSIG